MLNLIPERKRAMTTEEILEGVRMRSAALSTAEGQHVEITIPYDIHGEEHPDLQFSTARVWECKMIDGEPCVKAGEHWFPKHNVRGVIPPFDAMCALFVKGHI